LAKCIFVFAFGFYDAINWEMVFLVSHVNKYHELRSLVVPGNLYTEFYNAK